jgi:hypothetical protein
MCARLATQPSLLARNTTRLLLLGASNLNLLIVIHQKAEISVKEAVNYYFVKKFVFQFAIYENQASCLPFSVAKTEKISRRLLQTSKALTALCLL